MVVGLLHARSASRKAVELVSEVPGESKTASADYQRYLMREVFNDGRSKAVQMPSKRVVTHASAGPKAQRHVLHQKSVLQTLRVSGDEMSAQQAQRDIDAYWSKQSHKYKAEDVRSPRRISKLPRQIARHKAVNLPAHHSQYHYVKHHSFNDPRVEGAVPWQTSWHRPKGASSEPLEKFNTQPTPGLSAGGKTQRLRQTPPRAQGHRANSHDMPPLPGSFDSLVAGLHD